jgi:hypothetical protein
MKTRPDCVSGFHRWDLIPRPRSWKCRKCGLVVTSNPR